MPLVNTSAGVGYSQCERYDFDWNFTDVTCDRPEGDPGPAPVTACADGWVYDYEGRQSFVTEVSVRITKCFSYSDNCVESHFVGCVLQFDLVCADAWYVDMFQAALNVGFLLGSITIGYLADKYAFRFFSYKCCI